LQTWVAEGENRNACESRVVISRENANIYRGQRELISVRDMILVKKWPMEKIQGIIRRGQGIPDQDAPDVPSLTQYWVYTSRTQTEEDAVRQRSETQIAAQTTSAGVGAMMAANVGPIQPRVTINQDQLAAITESTQPCEPEGTIFQTLGGRGGGRKKKVPTEKKQLVINGWFSNPRNCLQLYTVYPRVTKPCR